MTRTVVVWGCTSGAGKSLLATALCRWAARQGWRVAPYKAQNMSNNARVVPGPDGQGAEIGSAQYHQALAAGVAPTVDMNPVLLKPEGDTRSQVVLHGRVDPALSRMAWRARAPTLAAAARASFQRLASLHDLLVVEGAGSPAETNLAAQDYVNLGVLRWASALAPTLLQARALLVADIDRGGAFAHCLGTWHLLPADLRPHLAGYVLNKFRGDASLLHPAPADLQRATGVPVLGVLPMWRDHGLPDEDGLPPPHGMPPAAPPGIRVLAVLAGPHLSNLDEFEPLAHVPGLQLRWVRHPDQLAGAHWLVLPGSKQVSGDLAWLRATGLDRAVAAHAAAGGPVLGLCGGLQMLGALLADPDGVDGPAHGGLPGLGLLPLETHYAAPKLLRPGRARLAHDLAGPWQALSGLVFDGYEIRCGRSAPLEAAPGLHTPLHQALHADDGRCIGWQHGSVLGLYAHGLFESPAVLHALFGAAGAALEPRLDALATWAEQHLGADTLQRLLGPGAKP